MNQPLKSLKVILIGDTCVDEYHYGTIDRLSPEAPVPVFVKQREEIKEGMAANVANNLEKLGVSVVKYLGLPSKKIRMIDVKSQQHVLRVDQDTQSQSLPTNTKFDFNVDAIVISDYDKGFVSYELIEQLIKSGLPVFVDTKKNNLQRFEGSFVKINNSEFQKAKTTIDNLIVTMGDRGVRYKNKIYPAPTVEITDVCGAGDTFLAALCYQYLRTCDIDNAIKFAIRAASVTVKHIGVYAPTLEEIS